ncbi:permease-like cell division protein FtsX [Paractinoplanes rhizophilus]|uniref:Permease-like cell division protein FtsX n=1 Tax=Paractinoplanes rhizophilus TaxID=1416877 RepID=A0ABW2HQE1_9ACTN
MEPGLREQFDRAVRADPGADPGEMAKAAMVHGGRIRRRRRLAVAGVAAVVVAGVGTVGAVALPDSAVPPAGPPAMVAAAMRLPAPECSKDPVAAGATDAAVFLHEATDRQRSAIGRALHEDERVATVIFESREDAYPRFAALWADSPEFVASVSPDSLPESYRLRLRDPAQFTAFSREYATKPGVQEIVGRICPQSAPVGGGAW